MRERKRISPAASAEICEAVGYDFVTLALRGRMERHFERDLNDLKERLLWMGSLAERAVHQAVHSVLDSDEQLANRVLAEEDAINELQIEVDDRVVQLLALHQLMAVDLRFVLAVSRINNDLERIGDQAVNIAQGSLRILRHPRVKPYVDLPRMSEVVEEMVRDALERRGAPRRGAGAKSFGQRRSGG